MKHRKSMQLVLEEGSRLLKKEDGYEIIDDEKTSVSIHSFLESKKAEKLDEKK